MSDLYSKTNADVIKVLKSCPKCGAAVEEAMSGGIRCSDCCGFKTTAFDFFEALEKKPVASPEDDGIKVTFDSNSVCRNHDFGNNPRVQRGKDSEGNEYRRQWHDASSQALGYGTSADGLRQEFEHTEAGWSGWEPCC